MNKIKKDQSLFGDYSQEFNAPDNEKITQEGIPRISHLFLQDEQEENIKNINRESLLKENRL